MSRRLQLVIILCAVTLMSTAISHSIDEWLKIENRSDRHWVIRPKGSKHSVFVAGSSLAGDGLSWGRISNALNFKTEGWAVGGTSPSEWEHFQSLLPQAKGTIIVVSAYDLNEYFLCDFHAKVVPLSQTIRDLLQSRSDWPFSKRLLGIYPLTYLRMLLPTTGRSDGVMTGVREKLKGWLNPVFSMESDAGPTLSFNTASSILEVKEEKISHWSESRMLRRLAGLRSACQGRNTFNGPKRLAFLRMLHQAQRQSVAIVVVLPVSPAYTREFLTPDVKQRFEKSLAEAQDSVPQARWVRMDQSNVLNSNDFFWDLVHMNTYGQQIATDAFLSRLREFKILQ
jgi:hypothetical protein